VASQALDSLGAPAVVCGSWRVPGADRALTGRGRGRARRGSLYAMLHSPRMHLSWGQVAYLCLGAARGMAHLHAHRCLHRDLKSGAPGSSNSLDH